MDELNMPLGLIKITCQVCKGEKFTIKVVCCGYLGKCDGDCCNEPIQEQVPCIICKATGYYEVKRL